MCGIIGYTGAQEASDILLEGLSKLEYRGYDSAGIAVVTAQGIRVEKAQGRLANLKDKIAGGQPIRGCVGIGHTRWATHGEPSDANAHPHACGRVTLVHNGIIENYAKLKEKLLAQGRTFLSQTDTEVAAHVLDEAYTGDARAALTAAMQRIKGSYALAVLFADRPGEIWTVRRDSPLILGLGTGENLVASDIPAILSHTRRYLLPEAGEIACVTRDSVTVYDDTGKNITAQKQVIVADWDEESAEKGGYPHFMLKEIMEQPAALRRAVGGRIAGGIREILSREIPNDALQKIKHVTLVACGSAMHAGLLGKHAIEGLARIPVSVAIASEFRYGNPIFTQGDAVFILSQSGETADSLAALRLAKAKGVPTYAVVNVVGSSIARQADHVIYLYSGPEIAVATTKAYSAQVAVLLLLALRLAHENGQLSPQREQELCRALETLPDDVQKTFALFDSAAAVAEKHGNLPDAFLIGRGQDYAVCCEGALKIKEISYVHSEAYAAGELKHGTISLITPGVPCIVVATSAALLEKTLSNAKEVKARGARVILLCGQGMEIPADCADEVIRLPAANEMTLPILAVIILQYYAYCLAVQRGCDVDKPRNLAKSVTVE